MAAVRMSRGVIPYMKNQGSGCIVNATTGAGKVPESSRLPTSVSRAAGINLTKSLANEFAKHKIRVNAISAGPIKTLAASAIGDAKFLYKWNENHSFLKRNVDIKDVGNSALYLLSDLAAGVTGEIHYVDAGYNKVGMPDPKNIS